ncbi:Mov34/MPN/PAD-1 [Geminocystis sp. NIES-3708]|uniref:Mov34/MPN/PAD-1 family protein n=1 Tax=Geminocystis sp. NIES-3708 TaxID=1615909 RepID=UPI0005FCDAC8|nr:M67 family metallopeptidase [Geminocystis sp. NIES-3708]BAQ60663.1 Mov34/MPN/PAD-1 [Geminocystis sp. NIES-3708]
MTINISQKNIKIIQQHGVECYPHECCGLLLGNIKNKEKTVIKVLPTINDWDNQKHLFTSLNARLNSSLKDSFAINPITFIQIQKQARQDNLNIIGIYHSHPDSNATPSIFDEAIAWDIYSYVIVSVIQGKSKDLFSWILDRNQKFIKELINFQDYLY